MMSLGLVLFVGGLAYRGLHFDLIPDWIPLFGKLDDLAAGGVAGAGCAMMYFGWHYGTGPKPTEAIAVANALAVANAHLAPAKKAAIAAIKASCYTLHVFHPSLGFNTRSLPLSTDRCTRENYHPHRRRSTPSPSRSSSSWRRTWRRCTRRKRCR